MNPTRSEKLYTVEDAAARVGRSRPTIERWIAGGLPVVALTNDSGRVVLRMIREADLLSAFRSALGNNPTRQKIKDNDETGGE